MEFLIGLYAVSAEALVCGKVPSSAAVLVQLWSFAQSFPLFHTGDLPTFKPFPRDRAGRLHYSG